MSAHKVKFIDYQFWYQSEKKQIDELLLSCLTRGQLMLREEVEEFERNLAKYVGAKYAVGMSNCTDALRLALIAKGIKPGDEVITSAHTFAATVAAIEQAGGTPVLADIKSSDHLIDIDSVKKMITSKTKAIIPVSINGRVADCIELEELANENGMFLLEDAAQGLGAFRKGKMSGNHGVGGCFSYYPAKTLGALGDAGAFTTNDIDMYNKMMLLRNHMRDSDGDIKEWGYNCRIDNIQAAVLNFRLSQMEKYVEKRRHIASLYYAGLSDLSNIVLSPNDRNTMTDRDAYQNFEFEADDRDKLLAYLRAEEIEIILPWGGKAIHHHTAFKGEKWHLKQADSHFKRIMTLPMHIALTDDQAACVIETVRKFYKK